MRYRTVVADPPWDVKRGPDWGSGGTSRELPYPTMSLEEIADLPVRELAEKRSHLYIELCRRCHTIFDVDSGIRPHWSEVARGRSAA